MCICIFVFSSYYRSDYDEDKKKTAASDVQVLKPTASSSPSLHSTERPIAIQEPTTFAINYYIPSEASHTQTESRPEVYSDHMTIDPFLNTHKEPSVSTTAMTTTTASKVIRGKIPWNRLFGGKERADILGRLKRPSVTQKTTTTMTAETTTATPTTTPAQMPTTTTIAYSLAESENLLPLRHTVIKEGSLDEELSSGDFEFTTSGPSFHYITSTTSSYYSKSFTTAEAPLESKTLPSPPTVNPPSVESPDEAVLSGSGGLPDNWRAIRPKPGWTRGQPGRKRRPFRGRRPFNRPAINELYPSKTKVPSIEVTTMTVSLSKPLYTQLKKEGKLTSSISTDQMSKEEIGLYREFKWSTPSSFQTSTSTKTPLIPSTTSMPTTTKELHVPSGEQGYTNNPSPNSYMDSNDAYSTVYDHGNEATSENSVDFEPTTEIMSSKPKIVGGNAASFTVLSNSDAFLPCEAVGNPQPNVHWKRVASNTGTQRLYTNHNRGGREFQEESFKLDILDIIPLYISVNKVYYF